MHSNAMVESFFATVQHEVLDSRRSRSRDELRSAPFASLEITYNRERRHSSLGDRAKTLPAWHTWAQAAHR